MECNQSCLYHSAITVHMILVFCLILRNKISVNTLHKKIQCTLVVKRVSFFEFNVNAQ